MPVNLLPTTHRRSFSLMQEVSNTLRLECVSQTISHCLAITSQKQYLALQHMDSKKSLLLFIKTKK